MLSSTSTPPIYEFETASSWLRAVFGQKKNNNKKYSLRSFAKSIEISHTSLNRLFNLKSSLCKENIELISEKMGLSPKEKQYFVKIASDETPASQIDHFRIQAKSESRCVEDVASVLNPNAFAILQMIGADKKVKFSVIRAAKKLSINPTEVRHILSKLLNLRLIKDNGKSYSVTTERLLIQSDEAKESLLNCYQTILTKGAESLRTHSANERYIGSETIAFNEKDIPLAKKIIDDALDSLAALSLKSENPNEVFQCATVFFRLTNKD